MDEVILYSRTDSPVWYAKLNISGKVKRISTKTPDKTEAYQYAYREFIRLATAAKFGISDTKTTLGQVFSKLPQRHNKMVASVYNTHIKNQFGKTPIALISPDQIKTWINAKPLSCGRLGDIARVIHRIFELAIEMKIIDQSRHPHVRIKWAPPNVRATFSPSEMELLLKKLEDFATKSSRNLLLKHYVHLILGTGVRPGGEVEQLRWSDYSVWNVKNGKPRYKLRIRPETNKTKRGREAIVNSDTAFSLENLQLLQMNWKIYEPNGLIFQLEDGSPFRYTYAVWDRFMRFADLMFDDCGNKRPIYSLRHYYITEKIKEGVPVHFIAKQCGNSVRIIERTYDKVVALDVADYFS